MKKRPASGPVVFARFDTYPPVSPHTIGREVTDVDELYHYLCLTDLLDQDLSAYEFFQTLSAAEQSALRRYGSEITSFSELQSRASSLRAEPETWG